MPHREQECTTEELVVNYALSPALLGLLVGWAGSSGIKSQAIRLVDIVLIGPFLIYVAQWLARKGKFDRHLLAWVLAFLGGATISYNLKNYVAQA